MKLTISKSALLDGLTAVQGVVSIRSTLPILSNALLEAADGRLALSTTDLDLSMRRSVPAEVSTPGGVTLPVRRLLGMARELPDESIELELDDKNGVALRCGAVYYRINGLAPDEFPPLPALDAGLTYSIEQSVLREMLRKTAYAVSTDETRHVLNGVNFSFRGDKLTVVATDGRRLALVEQEMEIPRDGERDIIVPSKAVNELLHVMKDDGPAKIHILDSQMAVEFGDTRLVTKLIEGSFPNFRQVIPSKCEERVAVERESLLLALRRASLLTSDKSHSIRLAFSKNTLEISATSPDVGEARERLPIKYGGKDIAVAFNPEFVMDPLRNLDSDEIYFELTDELSPGVMKCDLPFLYVLMPMRVN